MSAHHFSGRFFVVDLDEAARRLRMTRTAAPFASPDEMQRAHREVLRAVAPFRGHRLLLDVRNGPSRNDPEYEEVLAALRKQIVERVAILVRSAVGGLHATRLAREDGVQARIFQDEALALAYLERASRR
ncbi:MAG: hypothetical protein ACXVDD_05075 [Polyangia bacterium]